jgi:acid phosphatase type 7
MVRPRQIVVAGIAALGLALGGAVTASAAVIAAAGDIACAPDDPFFFSGSGDATHCAQRRTANLVGSVDAVLPLGDEQYNSGSLTNYLAVFDKTWGAFKGKSYPVPGNHEYGQTNAGGYFSYFGSRAGTKGQGWYSFDVGGWHLIAVNSECDRLGSACASGGAQEQFVRADLAAHPASCTLAYWHEPRFSSGSAVVKNAQAMAPIWTDLYNAGVDLVLTAHKHSYERFAPLNASGQPLSNSRGMREIIIGTGGEDHAGRPAAITGSQVINNKTFGVLKVTLAAGSYSWQFVGEPGSTFSDSGSTACH